MNPHIRNKSSMPIQQGAQYDLAILDPYLLPPFSEMRVTLNCRIHCNCCMTITCPILTSRLPPPHIPSLCSIWRHRYLILDRPKIVFLVIVIFDGAPHTHIRWIRLFHISVMKMNTKWDKVFVITHFMHWTEFWRGWYLLHSWQRNPWFWMAL